MEADATITVGVEPGKVRFMFEDGFVVDVISPLYDSRINTKLSERYGHHGNLLPSPATIATPELIWPAPPGAAPELDF